MSQLCSLKLMKYNLSHERIFKKTQAAKFSDEWQITLTKTAVHAEEGLGHRPPRVEIYIFKHF